MDGTPGIDQQPPQSRQASDVAPERLQRLRKVAQDFEALFVGTLLRSMRNTVLESDLIDNKGEIKYYRQLLDEEMAQGAARSGSGLGIADLIMRQFQASLGDQVAGPGQTGSDPSTSTPAGGEKGVLPALPPDRGVARYRSEAAHGKALAAMIHLQRQASRLGPVQADSLRRFSRPLTRAAAETGVDPALLFAVMMTESGGKAASRSSKGALGLMQLMPDTARELGVRQPLQPAENLLGGARYLARLLERFDNDLDLALAAYNAGPGAVERAGERIPPYAETSRYVSRVRDLYGRLQGEGGTDFAIQQGQNLNLEQKVEQGD